MSLRVLHVIPSVSMKRGGPSAAVFGMVRALQERGVRAELATTDDDGAEVLHVVCGKLMERDGISLRYFHRYSPGFRAVREFSYAPGFGPWLSRHLDDYDLIHAHALFSYLPAIAMRLARARGVPYVIRPLGQLGRWPLRQSHWRKRLFLALGERANLQQAAAVHFTSESEWNEASELGLTLKGVLIPHGIESPILIPGAKTRLRRELGLDPAQKVVLFLGRLHQKKGLDLLIPALAERPDLFLVLAGTGEAGFMRELEKLIARYELASRVRLMGLVGGKTKQLLLQGADLFALTSRHENFGLAVLEAMAAGLPVLVSDQVALAREVTPSLGEVVPLEAKVIGAAMGRLLKAETQAGASDARAQLLARYSWTANAASLHALYASILK